MGLLTFFQTSRKCKEIQQILDMVNPVLNVSDSVKRRNPSAITSQEQTSIEWELDALIGCIRDIDNICITDVSNTIYREQFRLRGLRRPLKAVMKEVISEVIRLREHLKLPPAYIEEIELFTKYR